MKAANRFRISLFLAFLALFSFETCEPATILFDPEHFDIDLDFVTIPAGAFRFGLYDSKYSLDYDYEILKYPVTVAQYAHYLNEGLKSETVWLVDSLIWGHYSGDEHWPAADVALYEIRQPDAAIIFRDGSFQIRSDWAYHPVVWVTWYGAKLFADFYSCRLPHEEEWEKAARANSTRDYPWGDEIDGHYANFLDSGDPFDNGTTPVDFYNGRRQGSFQTIDAASPYGVYDMAGNVWEWTDGFAGTSVYHIIKGGSFNNAIRRLRSHDKSLHFPYEKHADFGFRLARLP